MGFDQVLAWEMTLLEPKDYWRRVPPQWKPFWHFYNVPIHSDLGHGDSPLRFLQQLATPEDFVAFKLDIDHPDVEEFIDWKVIEEQKVAALVTGCPETPEFSLRYARGEGAFTFDTAEIREALGGVPLNRPEVLSWIGEYIRESIMAVDAGREQI